MKTINNPIYATLAAAALAVSLLAPTSARADDSAPVHLTFEKTLAGPGPAPYLFHFTGSFSGDFSGQLWVGQLVREFVDEQHQIVHVVADYVFTADDGIHSFTARVEGHANFHTSEAVLNGVVTAGWLEGAQVQDEFDILGGGHFQGTFRISPASAE
jgi:hypothetical protein